jgi:hypothetical protein
VFREAVAESGFDENLIIDAMFDPDGLGCTRQHEDDTLAAHLSALETLIERETDPDRLAAAAMILAVSVGYSPSGVAASPGLSKS